MLIRLISHQVSCLGYKEGKVFFPITCCRFEGDAGTAMADSCVLYGHCGTSEPGWFNGKLPEVKDGKKPGTVCFNDGKHERCCNSKVGIQVRNCSGFFVYRLPYTTNGCFKAYCGNGE